MSYRLITHHLDDGLGYEFSLSDGLFAGPIRGKRDGTDCERDRMSGAAEDSPGESAPGSDISLGLATLALQVLRDAAAYHEEVERGAKLRGRPASCRKGCAACCRQLVTVSPPEALLLLDTIDTLPGERREQLLARFEQMERRIDEAGLLDGLLRLNDPALTEEDHFRLAGEFHARSLPCPFLERDLCGLYATRPAACREYLVSTPPARCDDPFRQVIEPLPVALPLRDALASLAADVTNSEIELVPLPLLPRWGRKGGHEALRRRRWRVRRLAELFVNHVEYALNTREE